jgi:hypothetical protein
MNKKQAGGISIMAVGMVVSNYMPGVLWEKYLLMVFGMATVLWGGLLLISGSKEEK